MGMKKKPNKNEDTQHLPSDDKLKTLTFSEICGTKFVYEFKLCCGWFDKIDWWGISTEKNITY